MQRGTTAGFRKTASGCTHDGQVSLSLRVLALLREDVASEGQGVGAGQPGGVCGCRCHDERDGGVEVGAAVFRKRRHQ